MKRLHVGKRSSRIIKYMAVVSAVILALTAGTYTSGMPAYVYAAEEMNATGTVTNDTLNVRKGPGTDSDVIGQLHNGDIVDITGIEDGWYRIEFDEEVGYVAGNYIELVEGSGEVLSEEEVKGDSSEDAEAEEGEDEQTPDTDYKMLLIMGGVILMLVIIIFATIKSIKKLSDDEYDDYDDYDEYDGYDEYDNEEEEYDEEEYYEDEYDEEQYEDDDEYYDEPVRPIMPAQKAVRDGADPARYMSNDPNDYRIDIDPSYFEKTAALPPLDEELLDDTDAPSPISADSDAPKPIGTAPSSDHMSYDQKPDKEVRIEEALKKMEELKAEIESIKNEQT